MKAQLIENDPEAEIITEKLSLLELFKNKSYMIVFAGQLTNFIAGILMGMTFSYLIYATTENAALMGLMNIIGILPSILITLFAGVIVDRYDQRKILFAAMIMRCVVFIGFLVTFLMQDNLLIKTITEQPLENGLTQIVHVLDYTNFIWIMYGLLFFSNIGMTFLSLAVSAYSKFIIQKKNLLIANSFNQTIIQFSSIIAPIAAGAIITISYLYSFIIGVVIISLATILAIVLMYKGKIPTKTEREKQENLKAEIKQVFNDLRVGYTATKSEPKIVFALIIYVIFNFATASINGLYTVITQGEMALTPTWLGALQAVMAAIAVLTALIIMKIGKIDRKLIIVLLVVFLEAIGLFLFAFNRNPWILICVNTIPFGFVNGAANIPTQTLRQELFSHEKQGRVFSIAVLFTALANLLGNIIVASISNFVKPTYILLVGGTICVIVSIIGLILFKVKSTLHGSDYQEELDQQQATDMDLPTIIKDPEPSISSYTLQDLDENPTLE
ncbi:MAG: MFS transporter [Asgard group archaeon]|nr:MFS transporter [Asgard group archaeon]